jgi:3-methyladenine DNA glycosylase AlkD
MNLQQVLERLQAFSNPEKIELKEKKFGITANNSFGIYHQDLGKLAKEIGRDDTLALELYETGIYEARILCSKIYRPESLTEEQMERWAGNFENWALRNIGKRNTDLQKKAVEVADRILSMDSKSAKWIARNAIAELRKPGANVLDYPRSIYRPTNKPARRH